MQRRSFIITAALVAGLALGVVFGPVLRGATAGAQTEPPGQGQSNIINLPARPVRDVWLVEKHLKNVNTFRRNVWCELNPILGD